MLQYPHLQGLPKCFEVLGFALPILSKIPIFHPILFYLHDAIDVSIFEGNGVCVIEDLDHQLELDYDSLTKDEDFFNNYQLKKEKLKELMFEWENVQNEIINISD